MLSNWPRSYALVRKSEGGNDDDPSDHGGRTSRGITQREYTAWRQLKGLPDADVWQATEDEIQSIYHDGYWEPYCDDFPVGSDYLFFDMAVNAGPHRAAIMLQRALGVAADGRIGPVTKLAVREADPKSLVEKYSAAKRDFYIGLHQPRFTKGWLNRTNQVQSDALAMLAQEVTS